MFLLHPLLDNIINFKKYILISEKLFVNSFAAVIRIIKTKSTINFNDFDI